MKEIEAIKQALAAGPTPGPWFVCRTVNDDGTVDIETGRIAQDEWPPAKNCEFPTCHYIAACNPAAMQAVIAHIDSQAAEIERLRAAIKAAYEEGFYSSETYNDMLLNSAEETWPESQAAIDACIAAAMKETP